MHDTPAPAQQPLLCRAGEHPGFHKGLSPQSTRVGSGEALMEAPGDPETGSVRVGPRRNGDHGRKPCAGGRWAGSPPSTVHRGRGEPGEGAVQMAEHLSEGTGHMGVVTAVAKGRPGAGRSEPGRRGVCSV